MFILTSFLLTLKTRSILALLSTIRFPFSRFLFVIKTEYSLNLVLVVSGTAMKSSNFLLYLLFDKTNAGRTLEVFRSENGKDIKTISLCESIFYRFFRYMFQISSPLLSHSLRNDCSDCN